MSGEQDSLTAPTAQDLALLSSIIKRNETSHWDDLVESLLRGDPFRGGVRMDPDDLEITIALSYARAKGVVVNLEAIIAKAEEEDPWVDPARSDRRAVLPEKIRRLVFERDDYRCVRCGDRYAIAVDHIQPWSKGGSNDPDNLQTLCRSCNSGKRDRWEPQS